MLAPKKLVVPRMKSNNSHDVEFNEQRRNDPLWVKSFSHDWVRAMFSWSAEMEGKEPSDVRVFILQGSGDRVVTGSYNVKIYERLFPNAQTHWFVGAKHHLLFEKQPWRQEARKVVFEVLAEES